MTIDTTVTNGRFVGPDGVFEHSISVHEGRVLDTPEFDDVWRTVNASGHVVLPGMIQPGSFEGAEPLTLARRGTTTLLVTGDPGSAASMDYLRVQAQRPGIVGPSDLDAIERTRSGEAMIEVPVTLLTGNGSQPWWHVVADDELPVHVTHGGDTGFPLLQFLFHQGGLSLERIAAVTSMNPARWYGIHPEKGTFETGSHGDVIVFDPDTSDPYHDFSWPGRIIMSIQRGHMLLYNGQIHADDGAGQALSS